MKISRTFRKSKAFTLPMVLIVFFVWSEHASATGIGWQTAPIHSGTVSTIILKEEAAITPHEYNIGGNYTYLIDSGTSTFQWQTMDDEGNLVDKETNTNPMIYME